MWVQRNEASGSKGVKLAPQKNEGTNYPQNMEYMRVKWVISSGKIELFFQIMVLPVIHVVRTVDPSLLRFACQSSNGTHMEMCYIEPSLLCSQP